MSRLIGERIVLREVRREDLPHIREWVNDWEIVRFLSDIFLYPHTMNDTEGFINSSLEHKDNTTRNFIIAYKDSLDYIGQIGLIKIDWKNRSAEMGIVIGKKDCLGQGIGAEAIELLQYLAFYKMNLNRLTLAVHDFNERAIKCYKKCGFVEEGRLRQRHYFNGKYCDSILMSILKNEYEARESRIRNLILQNVSI